ncbi:MAG: permease-like cell division protein FtsX [Candidatus Saccharibacteria bacterium]
MTKNNSKRSSRRLLTFFRMFRYGFDSFIRNSWLSVAATAVMTITLLIIFTAFVAQNVLTDTVGELRNKVDMSIYLKTETTDLDATELTTELKKLSSVRSVTYVSAAAAREKIIEANKGDNNVLDAIKEATNKNPATLRVVVNDINDTTQLQDFVSNNVALKDHLNADYKPSFAGERRSTIESIGRAVDFAQKVGIAAGSVFMVISALIIFNTIRMAIFNRREEIQMMKLIGANQSFIRGPFLVEATMYGFIAAIIATGSGVWALFSAKATLTSYQISVQPTIDLLVSFGWIVLFAMIVIGAVIGVVSSLFATYRYLKL